MEYALIDALITKLHSNAAAKQFSEIYPDDPELKEIFYKMLKGTNLYTQELGIPPFAHFFSLEKSSKAIQINYTSKEILTSTFGQELTDQILAWEQEQHSSRFLSAKEFEQLTPTRYEDSSLLSTLGPFISYAKHSSKQKILYRQDPHTNIGIERPIHTAK